MLRESSFALLGEDQPPVGNHVVLALGPLERFSVVPVLDQLSRETRGSFVVAASDRAVEDLDAHSRGW